MLVEDVVVGEAGSMSSAMLIWAVVLFIYNLKYAGATKRLGHYTAADVLNVDARMINAVTTKVLAVINANMR